MNNDKTKLHTKHKAISTNKVVIPFITVLVILHLLIIYLIMTTNMLSSNLALMIQQTAAYTQDATTLLAGSSLLSETSTSVISYPINENGEQNIGPLMAYAKELGEENHRGPKVAERFQKYDVSDEAKAAIATAAENAEQMLAMQLHALSLLNSVYPLPDNPVLNTIPLQPLSAAELAMTDPERLAAAEQIILGSDYGNAKFSVTQNVNACTDLIREEMTTLSAKTASRLASLRTWLWIVTFTIIAVLAVGIILLYRLLIRPLKGDVRLITTDNMLDEGTGILEMRMLAGAYNSLVRRRDTLESLLRSAAETDVLTNLPNRYSFEQVLTEMAESGHAFSLVLFDVNFLKDTNDTSGHAAGDELLRNSAECIASCFGNAQRDNCFRIGGDEFAAILPETTAEDLTVIIERFVADQQERKISIAWGTASTEEIANTTFKKLMRQADQMMYRQKERMHQHRDAAFAPVTENP